MIVAFTSTASPIPKPMALMTTASARPKEKKTVAMIRAAPVIRHPVRSMPRVTEERLSPVRSSGVGAAVGELAVEDLLSPARLRVREQRVPRRVRAGCQGKANRAPRGARSRATACATGGP